MELNREKRIIASNVHCEFSAEMTRKVKNV